jgi:hypothetical protein
MSDLWIRQFGSWMYLLPRCTSKGEVDATADGSARTHVLPAEKDLGWEVFDESLA